MACIYSVHYSVLGPMWAGWPMSVSCSTLPTPNTTNIITSLHSRADPAAFSFFSSAKNSSKSQVFWLLRMFAQHIDWFLLVLRVDYSNDIQLPDQSDNPCVSVHIQNGPLNPLLWYIAGSPFPASIILQQQFRRQQSFVSFIIDKFNETAHQPYILTEMLKGTHVTFFQKR